MGGQIDGNGTGMLLVNQGNFVWTGGIVVDNGLLNQGSLTISGSGGQSIGTGTYWYPSPGVLTNAGTITHATDGVLLMVGGSVLNNLAGAVYDLQGDGQITTDVNWWAGGTINNAGLFRTSSGTGTSSIHPYIAFNNTGTVEVDSGTLTFGSGSSVAAHYEFANGSRVNASLTWQGENTANGNGVLAVGGSVAAGTTASFSSSGFTNGAQLEVGSGYSGSLNVESGATLTLNMRGSQQATMVDGYLHGLGTTINLGNFALSGGQIGGDGTGTVVNQGDFVYIGGNVTGNLVNQGSFVWTGGNVTGNLINQGSFLWTGGNVMGGGGLTNQSSQFTISGNGGQAIGTYTYGYYYYYSVPGVLTNVGTITHAADGVLQMSSGSTLNNQAGAVYDLQGDGQITPTSICGGGTINNAGLFRKSAGSGTSSVDPLIAFNNTGTVEVDSGTLALGSGFSTNGHYEFANGGQLQASLTWQGENTANGNGVLQASGSVAAGTTATFDNFTGGASLRFGSLAPASGATLNLNLSGSNPAILAGGSLGGDGTTNNLESLLWTGGAVVGSGGLTNQGSIVISGSGGQGVGTYVTGYYYGYYQRSVPGVLTNVGMITHAADVLLQMSSGSTLNNQAGAVYDLQGDGQITPTSICGGGTINNAGLFRKSAGSGTSSVDPLIAFNNTGTVEVDSGTLALGSGFSTNGHYEFANGGQLQASLTWQGENTANGNGVLQASGSVAAGTTATFDNFTGGASLRFGSLAPASGATLNLNLSGSNPAILAGGSLGGDGTTNNLESLLWTGGAVVGSGGLTNQGSIVISGSGGQGVGTYVTGYYYGYYQRSVPGVLTNVGMITHAADVLLQMSSGSTLNNQAGAVYDLQGDGQITPTSICGGGTINNAGLFRKSAGSGTSSVDPLIAFNNTGTVEVDSGTLALGSGFSTNGHYEFANGGQLQASLTWQGENTANGNGVLQASGSVAAGTTATFDNFTGGASLRFGSLAPASGATLNLNLSGSNPAILAGGSLGGDGTTNNLESLLWTGGAVVGSGGLTNQGSIVISGSGGQGVGTYVTGYHYGYYQRSVPGVLTNVGMITHAAEVCCKCHPVQR